MKYKVLLVDDDETNLFLNRELLEREGDPDFDFTVEHVLSGQAALALIKKDPYGYSAVVLDLRMPGKNGVEVAVKSRELNRNLQIIFHSANICLDSLQEISESGGAVKVILKGSPDESTHLIGAIKSCCRSWDRLDRTVLGSESATDEDVQAIRSIGMRGTSRVLAEVAKRVIRYRKYNESVLIEGEPGTGKELTAMALGEQPQANRKGKFIAVNCAQFNGDSTLADSELFGHVKGAFTGATCDKLGIFEAVKGGTVFLDEVDRLPWGVQQNLLRVLQEKKIRKVGSTTEYSIQFRLVAATKPRLEERTRRGKFLEDLFYRLSVLTIVLPPLRERPEDLFDLVRYFNEEWVKETGEARFFLQSTVKVLQRSHWRGNVRELRNFVRRSLIDCQDPSGRVRPEHLEKLQEFSGNETARRSDRSIPGTIPEAIPDDKSELDRYIESKKRDFYVRHLSKNDWKVLRTAKKVGMDRKTLGRELERLGIEGRGQTKGSHVH